MNNNSNSSAFSFGSHFPEEYFLGHRKEIFIEALGITTNALDCYKAFISLCESLPMTSSDRSMCVSVLEKLLSVNPNWFLLPTSTGGKYHGGMFGEQNTCGGIYQHCLRLCNLANSVLKRYAEVIASLKLDVSFDMTSKLLACCLLHDIGRLAFSQSAVYSVPDHGEQASLFIESAGYGFEGVLLYAISNHMYGWKAINVFNHIVAQGASSELVLLLMLCECDFFGSIS